MSAPPEHRQLAHSLWQAKLGQQRRRVASMLRLKAPFWLAEAILVWAWRLVVVVRIRGRGGLEALWGLHVAPLRLPADIELELLAEWVAVLYGTRPDNLKQRLSEIQRGHEGIGAPYRAGEVEFYLVAAEPVIILARQLEDEYGVLVKPA
jgi:hypothetical protein